MDAINRRSFLKLSARLSVAMGLSATAIPRVAEALEELSQGLAPVLWLQGQCCSGCSVSLLNSEAVKPVKLLTHYLNLGFHQTLSAATGNQAVIEFLPDHHFEVIRKDDAEKANPDILATYEVPAQSRL